MKKKTAEERKVLSIGVLGSGKGSNCQALIDSIAEGKLKAKISCVISDVENAYILDRAKQHGIPARYISAAPFRTKLEGDAEKRYVAELKKHKVDVVVLAGFMRVIKGGLLKAFPGRILNIHPSLLPAFQGLEAWKQALAYGVKIAGCTVHVVDDGVDTGPILVQKPVPIFGSDTAETLHARIQEQEHLAYPEALMLITAGIHKIGTSK